jgi:hypothetical protein
MAAADDRVDACWRPWRMAALNLMLISLVLVVGLMAGGTLIWGRMRPERRVGRSAVRAVLASMRAWLPWRRFSDAPAGAPGLHVAQDGAV